MSWKNTQLLLLSRKYCFCLLFMYNLDKSKVSRHYHLYNFDPSGHLHLAKCLIMCSLLLAIWSWFWNCIGMISESCFLAHNGAHTLSDNFLNMYIMLNIISKYISTWSAPYIGRYPPVAQQMTKMKCDFTASILCDGY